MFRDSARECLEGKGLFMLNELCQCIPHSLSADSIDCLAAALAVLSGYTQMKSRSLMSSAEGFVTCVFTSRQEIRSVYYVWNALKSDLSEQCTAAMRGMTLFKDMMGAAFDVPQEYMKEVKEYIKRHPDQVQIATELPELVVRERSGYSQGRGNYNSPSNRNGNRRSFGGSRGRGGFRGKVSRF